MTEKIRCQLMVDFHNYQWLTEEMICRRHKNLSITINEILKNYQIMIRSMQKATSEKERIEKAKQDADSMIDNYRKQITHHPNNSPIPVRAGQQILFV